MLRSPALPGQGRRTCSNVPAALVHVATCVRSAAATPCRLHAGVCRAAAQEVVPDAAAGGSPDRSTTASLASLEELHPLTFAPEDFELPPGQLSTVDRTSALSQDDVFRCPGCTKAECQVSTAARQLRVHRACPHPAPGAAADINCSSSSRCLVRPMQYTLCYC
jgi:hypothetical protein